MQKETLYRVSGMKCQGCVAAVKDAVSRLPNCVEVRVDLDAGTALVVGDVDPQVVTSTVTASGYPTEVAPG